MALLQDMIHKLEAGGRGCFRYLPAILAGLLVALAYDLRDYRNFSTEEAMDAAQLGRRIAEGKGYTTLFIRPFSMYLISRTNQQRPGAPPPGKSADQARIQKAHPDIANAPVYPFLLAGLMKALPFDYSASTTQPFWSSDGHFWRYQPDFLIALVNEILFAALIVLTFCWARRLFDPMVAWTAALLMLGAELLWRFSVSGLSTMLLLLLFMGLVWCLTLLEVGTREPKWRPATLFALAAAAGLLVALGGLTRYAFAWLILPTLIFLVLFTGPRRVILSLTTIAVFAAVMTPWIIRNYTVSGVPFGTATYHVLEGTELFPGYRLECSLAPNIQFFVSPIGAKLLANTRPILQELSSNLGGWISGFFLVGLLVGFRNPSIRRIRYFLLSCLGLLVIVQALGSTHLSEDSPQINSENLLVLLLPLVVIYGVSLFFTLLDQLSFPTLGWRYSAVGVFGVLACLPMIFALVSPISPVVYPPYHPPLIQQAGAWMKDSELVMSDIPWAVAWYGERQCVWLTLNAVPDPDSPFVQENFSTINAQKPINALYLTRKTTDSRFVSDWVGGGEFSWGKFTMDAILKKQVPLDFPLHQMPTGFMPEQLFLADWKRWR
jgi:hypothetical protein